MLDTQMLIHVLQQEGDLRVKDNSYPRGASLLFLCYCGLRNLLLTHIAGCMICFHRGRGQLTLRNYELERLFSSGGNKGVSTISFRVSQKVYFPLTM